VILIHSPFSRPSFNLALEEYLLGKNWKGSSLLLFYENDSSVVMGKNQNFFSEVNIARFIESETPVFRRVSGGGTVYHGPGNLNFAFIRDHEDRLVSNFKAFNKPIVETLNRLGAPAKMNERNDILCEGFKVSGNAQFTNRKRMISHGTLLLNSDLKALNGMLQPNPYEIESRSIPSVRSRVANISDFLPSSLSVVKLIDSIAETIEENEQNLVYGLTDKDIDLVRTMEEQKYQTAEWNFNRASKCHIKRTISDSYWIELKIDAGQITEVNSNIPKASGLIGTSLSSSLLRSLKKPDDSIGLLKDILC
jgi:lipoate-protein ligase A